MGYEIPRLAHTINGRHSMRSVADALEALRETQHVLADSVIEVRTSPLPSRTAARPSIVLVVCRAASLEPTWGVALPTSYEFKARPLGQETTETFNVSLLDRAKVDNNGTVTLSDGTRLRAVSVIPAALPWEMTEREKRIVYWAIKYMGQKAEADCYRFCRPNFELTGLDYGKLHKLAVDKLEALVQYIADHDPDLCVCRQTVANALGRSGMRAPLSRGRRADREPG